MKAAQKVISASQGESGADKLRQEMIPKRPAGPSPRIIACADGKTEGAKTVSVVCGSNDCLLTILNLNSYS